MSAPSTSSLFFAATCVLAGYCTDKAWRPPNPVAAATPQIQDRIHRFLYNRPRFGTNISTLTIRRLLFGFFYFYHVLLILLQPTTSSAICPKPQNLNRSLFSWSPTTVTILTLVITGSLMRLLAFAQLGRNFTFQLARPKALVTSGMYAYVQHPSYTGNFLIFTFNSLFLFRGDAGLGCWLPRALVESRTAAVVGTGVVLALAVGMCVTRVRDEEKMLSETFPGEWEVWNRKTKRFVPGLF